MTFAYLPLNQYMNFVHTTNFKFYRKTGSYKILRTLAIIEDFWNYNFTYSKVHIAQNNSFDFKMKVE